MKKDEFKPYIPADKITPEFTVTSVIMVFFWQLFSAQPMRILVCVSE